MQAALVANQSKAHMAGMASAVPESTARKSVKHGSDVLGRSAATGRLVLRPAISKGASITIEEVRAAVKAIQAKKK